MLGHGVKQEEPVIFFITGNSDEPNPLECVLGDCQDYMLCQHSGHLCRVSGLLIAAIESELQQVVARLAYLLYCAELVAFMNRSFVHFLKLFRQVERNSFHASADSEIFFRLKVCQKPRNRESSVPVC